MNRVFKGIVWVYKASGSGDTKGQSWKSKKVWFYGTNWKLQIQPFVSLAPLAFGGWGGNFQTPIKNSQYVFCMHNWYFYFSQIIVYHICITQDS